MICNMESLLGILPLWLREELGNREDLQEIRLRLEGVPELIYGTERRWLRQKVRRSDLDFCVNAASRYSPWRTATASQGYVTAQGGHRIGIAGETVVQDGVVTGVREITSLCIRVARDFPGIGQQAAELPGSLLILGAPGWGKTTLLRDVIRLRSRRETVSVVDERGELFPPGFEKGPQTDVLTGCPKPQGILRLLKTMGPDTVAVDEITSREDVLALLEAGFCGCHLVATVHGESLEGLRRKGITAKLLDSGIFPHAVILRKDRSYRVEEVIS